VPHGRGDQAYVTDLCDKILSRPALREHRFDWLRGDPSRDGGSGRKLPVDAYWPEHALVVEYWEKQHAEPVAFFDKPDRLTVSGVSRGDQRAQYDKLRELLIPHHDLRLVIVRATDLACDRRGRLLREPDLDLPVIRRLIG